MPKLGFMPPTQVSNIAYRLYQPRANVRNSRLKQAHPSFRASTRDREVQAMTASPTYSSSKPPKDTNTSHMSHFDEEPASTESTSEVFKKTLATFSYRPLKPKTRTNESPKPSTPPITKEPRQSPRKPSNQLKTVEKPSIPRSPSSSKTKRGFAPPERYSHLNALQDYLQPNLDIVFCGINPGQKSAEIGHHFGGPTNHFWPCLYESGLTTERLQPTEDSTLPERFSIGITNLVSRPTAEQNELSRAEQVASVPALLDKIAQNHPRIVCFVGLGITDIVKSQVLSKSFRKTEKEKELPSFGLQPFKLQYDNGSETLFFAVASTSGRVVRYHKKHKVEQFRELKILLEEVKAGGFDTSKMFVVQR